MGKNSPELHSRVRRRLFEEVTETIIIEEEVEKDASDDKDQIVAEFLELCGEESASNHKTINDATPVASLQKQVIKNSAPVHDDLFRIMVVSKDETSMNTINALSQINKEIEEDKAKLKIFQCKTKEAHQLSNQQYFNVIFTDVDLSAHNEMLRVIIAIRKSNCNNHETPIIAVEQDRCRAHDLPYYGVTKVYFAPFNAATVKGVIEEVKNGTLKDASMIDPTDPTEHNTNPPAYTTNAPITTSNELVVTSYTTLLPPSNSSIITTAPKFDHEYAHPVDRISETVTSSITVPVISTANLTASISKKAVKKPTIQVVNEKGGPLVHVQTTAATTLKQQNIVRPIIQRTSVPVSVLPKPNMYYHVPPYLAPPVFPNNLQNRLPPSNAYRQDIGKSNDFSYMVTGTNAAANQITISMVPDDNNKHSTKERMRRERIRRCCEQFRELLPTKESQSNQSKRIDMATVMELTVFYIKLLQKHATSLCQREVKECNEVFEFYFNHTAAKRNASEVVDDIYNPQKIQRSNNLTKVKKSPKITQKSPTTSIAMSNAANKTTTKSEQLFQQSTNYHQHMHQTANRTIFVPPQPPPPTLRYMENARANHLIRPPHHYPSEFFNFGAPNVFNMGGGYYPQPGNVPQPRQAALYPPNVYLHQQQTEQNGYIYPPSYKFQ